LGIAWPFSRAQIVDILLKTVQASGSDEAMLRIYLSRGPGGFTTNPYESVGSQFYVVATAFRAMASEKYSAGVAIGRSAVVPKDPWFATVKSCNYLPNVMMKKEAVDRGLDFTIGFDETGVMTESSTENIMLLDREGFLVRPRLLQILKGTTMMRALELSSVLVGQGV
ncbi:MAG: peptidase, partial [Chitinophagaceae bacterium]